MTSQGQQINYSQLVISTGSKPETYGIEGISENAFIFNTYKDVSKIKNLIQRFNTFNKQKG